MKAPELLTMPGFMTVSNKCANYICDWGTILSKDQTLGNVIDVSTVLLTVGTLLMVLVPLRQEGDRSWNTKGGRGYIGSLGVSAVIFGAIGVTIALLAKIWKVSNGSTEEIWRFVGVAVIVVLAPLVCALSLWKIDTIKYWLLRAPIIGVFIRGGIRAVKHAQREAKNSKKAKLPDGLVLLLNEKEIEALQNKGVNRRSPIKVNSRGGEVASGLVLILTEEEIKELREVGGAREGELPVGLITDSSG